jgi:3-deoxy-D-manno-octulosonate 8-phosphate phosphatase (KDO 8-P phosphatase)
VPQPETQVLPAIARASQAGVRMRRDVIARARKVRALIMDVDGVLTDGRMVLSDRGDELKSFYARDGVALELARRAGIRTAMVTGESSPIATARGAKLGVTTVVLGARRKAETVDALLAEYELTPDAAAYIGDDLLDIPALQRVGLAVTVPGAPAEVRAVSHLVTKLDGGYGAVRECVEAILKAQGVWRDTVERFVRDHGGGPLRWSGRR